MANGVAGLHGHGGAGAVAASDAGKRFRPGGATPEGLASPPASDATAQAQATLEYWTPERMRQAIPMPMPSVAPSGDDVVREGSLPADAVPTLIPGWPGQGTPAGSGCAHRDLCG